MQKQAKTNKINQYFNIDKTMNIKSDLKKFYNKESTKYTSTRKKHRVEAYFIINEFNQSNKKTIKILELGCGWWRLLEHLSQVKKNIHYTWVDLSENLINISKKIAKKNEKIKTNFVCDDMTNYITKTKQEEFDFIVCIASFQHIPSIKERIFLLKNFYRSLKYEWKVIMTNRSFSQWFIKQYLKDMISSFFSNIVKYWNLSFKDILIPRKWEWNVYKRYYHIFTLSELRNIYRLSWFSIDKLCYLGKDWKESNNMRYAKNTVGVIMKNI